MAVAAGRGTLQVHADVVPGTPARALEVSLGAKGISITLEGAGEVIALLESHGFTVARVVKSEVPAGSA